MRSCFHSGAAVHDTGHQMMQTGRLFSGGIITPHAGCVASYLMGRRTDLPAHVIMPQTMGNTGGGLPHGQDSGFLGKAHAPFFLNADPSKEDFRVPDLLPPKQIGEVRLDRRRKLRDVVDSTVNNFEKSENAKLVDSSFEAAFRMVTSEQARAAFDLTREPKAVREKYGMSRFGQSCLLSRRLIEAGVRFVTVNTFLTVFDEITWDIHGTKPFTSIEGMRDIVAPMYDQGYAALIEDLDERGMLGNTMVCNLAEFGRTPRVNPAGGRDHWPQCWSMYFAGGGVQGGESSARAIRSAAIRPSVRSILRKLWRRFSTASASTSKRIFPVPLADRSRWWIPEPSRSPSCLPESVRRFFWASQVLAHFVFQTPRCRRCSEPFESQPCGLRSFSFLLSKG